MNGNVLELKGVTKRFHDEEVLEDINFEVKQGEFLTLLGPSGCGKTTLLRLISGFEEPDSGVICIDGQKDYRHKNDMLIRFFKVTLYFRI